MSVRALPGDLPALNQQLRPLLMQTIAPWAEPDPAILRRGRRLPPPLPGEEIFGPWNQWIRDAADGAGVPRDYVAMPLLAATAALIGNARVVSPWSGWREPAIIWAGAVGDPSAGKSPGADPVLSAVRDVQKQLGEGFDEKRRDWETLAASANATRDSWEAKVREEVKAGREPPTMPAAAVAPRRSGSERRVRLASRPRCLPRPPQSRRRRYRSAAVQSFSSRKLTWG
jgi:hypothetical protein